VAPRFPRTFYGPNAYRDCTGREHCLSTHLRSGRRVVRQSRLGRSAETVFREGWLTLFARYAYDVFHVGLKPPRRLADKC
jgi:hypothetical protein